MTCNKGLMKFCASYVNVPSSGQACVCLPACIWPLFMVPPKPAGGGDLGQLAGYSVKVTWTPVMPRTESRPPLPCQVSWCSTQPYAHLAGRSWPLSQGLSSTRSCAYLSYRNPRPECPPSSWAGITLPTPTIAQTRAPECLRGRVSSNLCHCPPLSP